MNRIVVDLRKEIETINPCIYGAFFSSAMYGVVDEDSSIPNINGIRRDMIEGLKRIRIGMLQWPGGDDWEYMRWRDTIGPRDKRPRRRNPKKVVKGDKLLGPWDNAFGVHEFLELCNLTGAEPYMGATLCYGDAGDFHDLVEYCNCPYETDLSNLRKANGHPEPFGVRYWCINNENGYITPEEYCGLVRQYFGFIPFFDTPPVRVIRPDGTDGVRRFFRSWKERGVYGFARYVPPEWNNLNPAVDLAAFLQYGLTGPCVNFTEHQWYISMAYGVGFQTWINEKREEFAESFNPRMGVGFNEWGCMHNETYLKSSYSLQQKDTLRDALTAAIALNVFNNNCDFMRFACISDVINVIHHMFEIKGEKLICTPTSFVYELYAPHQNGRCVETSMDVPRVGEETLTQTTTTFQDAEHTVYIPHVQVSSSLNDKVLTITAVNASLEEDLEARLEIKGGELVEVDAKIIHHERADAFNSVDHPLEVCIKDTAVRLTGGAINYLFPAHSITRFTARLK